MILSKDKFIDIRPIDHKDNNTQGYGGNNEIKARSRK